MTTWCPVSNSAFFTSHVVVSVSDVGATVVVGVAAATTSTFSSEAISVCACATVVGCVPTVSVVEDVELVFTFVCLISTTLIESSISASTLASSAASVVVVSVSVVVVDEVDVRAAFFSASFLAFFSAFFLIFSASSSFQSHSALRPAASSALRATVGPPSKKF